MRGRVEEYFASCAVWYLTKASDRSERRSSTRLSQIRTEFSYLLEAGLIGIAASLAM